MTTLKNEYKEYSLIDVSFSPRIERLIPGRCPMGEWRSSVKKLLKVRLTLHHNYIRIMIPLMQLCRASHESRCVSPYGGALRTRMRSCLPGITCQPRLAGRVWSLAFISLLLCIHPCSIPCTRRDCGAVKPRTKLHTHRKYNYNVLLHWQVFIRPLEI